MGGYGEWGIGDAGAGGLGTCGRRESCFYCAEDGVDLMVIEL